MRKLLTTFCVCLLLLSCAATTFAAESEDTSVDVKAMYVENTPWSAVSPDEDGTANRRQQPPCAVAYHADCQQGYPSRCNGNWSGKEQTGKP